MESSRKIFIHIWEGRAVMIDPESRSWKWDDTNRDLNGNRNILVRVTGDERKYVKVGDPIIMYQDGESYFRNLEYLKK